MAGKVIDLDGCVTCHAWDADANVLAWSPNNNELHIGDPSGNTTQVMLEHDQVIMSVDWAPKSNRIVTASQDRNAYVWTYDEKEKQWMPTLVILRINRAATCVKWSPKEDKFAVGSGAKLVSICYFEEENDWWVSKHIKKPIRSTVLSVDWHPNNVLLAAGSADFKCRIFSAFVKGVDKKGSGASSWGEDKGFGELIAEIDTSSGWVHGVSFAPSGDALACVTHNSAIAFTTPGAAPQIIKLKELPLKVCAFLNETTVVAAGYDNEPIIFTKNGDVWEMKQKLDKKKETAAKATTSATSAAFSKFQTATRVGATADTGAAGASPDTTHQNAISCIALIRKAGKVAEFSTTGYDGKLVRWAVPN